MSIASPRVLAFVLAGGEGSRLLPNPANSGIGSIYLLVQHKFPWLSSGHFRPPAELRAA